MKCPLALAVLTSSVFAVSPGALWAEAVTPPSTLNRSATHSGGAALDLKPVSRAEYLALYERNLPTTQGRNEESAIRELLKPLSEAVSGAFRVQQSLVARSALAGTVLGIAAVKGDEATLTKYEPVFDFIVECYLDPAREQYILNPFAPIGFFTAADALDRSGRLTGERREKVRQVALLFQNGGRPSGSVGNWAAALAVGQMYASRIFSQEPELALLRKRAAGFCEQLSTQFSGDVENATFYGAIGATQIFQAAALHGSPDRLNTPFYRGLYTRLACLVSEEGLQPSYGDNYFAGSVTLHMYMFEAAARTFRDPRFLRVARQVYEREAGSEKPKRFGALDKVFSLQLLSLPPYEGAPEPLPAFDVKARVFEHQKGHGFGSNPGGFEADKVVLKSPTSSVKAYAMLDVGTGGHGIPECRAAVLHYEVNGVPLVRGVEKNHTPEMANQIYLKPPGFEYPHNKRGFEAGVWYTQTVPLDLLAVDYLPEFKWDAIVLGKTVEWLFLDNIRFEGAGGTQVIESCESTSVLAPWNGGSTDYVLSPDHTEGAHSLKIPLISTRHGQTITSLTHKPVLDRQRFDSLKFDWKFEGSQAPLCFMRWGSALRGERGDVFPWTEFHDGAVAKAEAANNESGDCRAHVDFSHYVTADTRWSRDVLMSKEGVLLLVDRVFPGPKANGYTVGSLWQIDNLEAEGKNWFLQKPMNWPALSNAQPPRSAGMFVWHAPAVSGNRRIGHQSTKDTPGLFNKVPPLEFRPITTFASETAVAGKPLVFLTVVAPTLGTQFNPETFAQSIVHTSGESSAELRCRFDGTDLHFKVAADGAWSVERP